MERRRRESGIDFGVHAVMMVSPSKDVSTLAFTIFDKLKRSGGTLQVMQGENE